MASKVQLEKERQRRSRLERCKRDLWFLLCGDGTDENPGLGYRWNPDAGGGEMGVGKGLTERFHRKVCDWIQARKHRSFVGKVFGRWHHKTTIVVGEIIQDFLDDPLTGLLYWHAVDDLARQTLGEVAQLIRTNKWLRSLDPIGIHPDTGEPFRAFPHTTRKKFGTADRFTLNRVVCENYKNPYERFPSLIAKGRGSEITGFHGKKAYLDDVIAKNDIEDNQLPKIASWYESTVLPVVDDMMIRFSGTPWSDWGLYEDWKNDPDWCILWIPACPKEDIEEIDWSQDKIILTPDDDLARPVYGELVDRPRVRKKLKALRRQMKVNFDPQIQVNPSPSGEKPWSIEDCETRMSAEDANVFCPRLDVMISDPAPWLLGSQKQVGEKQRGDGTKDEWALAWIRYRMWGEVLQTILMWGEASQWWERKEGLRIAIRKMKRHGMRHLFNEAFGGLQSDYTNDARAIAREEGVRLYLEGRPPKLPAFGDQYAANAKNNRLAALAETARQGEFFICDSCPKEFLEDTKEPRYGFLYQMREFRPIVGSSRNSLKWDDRADVVARSTDSKIIGLAPRTPYFVKERNPFNPYRDHTPDDDLGWGTRHVRA